MEGVNTPSLPQICGRFVMFSSKKRASVVAQTVKNPACSGGDSGSIPGLGRSHGEGKGNPLQYSCLENPMDRGTWQAIDSGVAESDTTEQLKQNTNLPPSSHGVLTSYQYLSSVILSLLICTVGW